MSSNPDHPLQAMLRDMPAREASDLHLVPGYRPMYRIHGRLEPIGAAPLPPGSVLAMLKQAAPPTAAHRLEVEQNLDFALELPGTPTPVRFRVNVFSTRGEVGACFRAIAQKIPSLAELGFPPELADRLVALNNGLILVTGITGSGKTTTLAALIQLFNARGGRRIITIEEPVEFIYPPAEASLITQREVGQDVASFYEGLRFGLRQDPDVILVGEVRDRETAQLAVSAAETGHLIFATLHTSDAKGAITRLVDLFPSSQHDDIRTQLSLGVRAIITQHLLPSSTGGRRVLAMEVLLASYGVRSAIRQGKIESLDSAIQSGRREGMMSLDADLRRLVTEGRITIETARSFAKDPAEFGGA